MQHRLLTAIPFLLMFGPATAFAEEAVAPTTDPAPPGTTPGPSPPEPESKARTTAGVVVIVASLAAGAALTGYGLTIDCAELDHACHRRAAAPIWGGVGVAAVGSLVGLRLIQTSVTRSSASLTLHGTF
jgi:hypothetical protein